MPATEYSRGIVSVVSLLSTQLHYFRLANDPITGLKSLNRDVGLRRGLAGLHPAIPFIAGLQ